MDWGDVPSFTCLDDGGHAPAAGWGPGSSDEPAALGASPGDSSASNCVVIRPRSTVLPLLCGASREWDQGTPALSPKVESQSGLGLQGEDSGL